MKSSRTLSILLIVLVGVLIIEWAGFGQHSVVKPVGDRIVPSESRLDAFGDSIVSGSEIAFSIDATGKRLKTDKSFQGWPELLGALLSEHYGFEIAVENSGYSGDRTEYSRTDRLPKILRKSVKSDSAFLMTGTNDSNDFEPTPSGAGCSGTACEHTFKGELLSFINTLQESGRETVYIGRLVPAWGFSADTPYADPSDPQSATRKIGFRNTMT